MFHAGGNAVLLHLLDVGNDHPRGEVGILAHVLEIAAVERRAVDVHAGSQQDVLLAVARLLADGFAIQRRHFGIPRRGKARQRRESRAGVVRPAGLVPFVPQDLGADAVRAVGAPHLGNAQARNARRREFRLRMQDGDLLFEGHARKGVFDPLFDRLRLVEVDGDAALRLLRELVRHGVFVVVARRLHAVLRVIEEERQVGGLGTRYGERPVDGRRSEAHVLPHEAQRGLAVGNVLVEGKRHSPRIGSVAFGADHLLGDHLVVEEYLRLERRERIAVGHRHLEVDLAAVDARRIGRNDGHLGTDVGGEQFGIVLARRRRGSDEQRQCDVFQRFHVLRILKVSFRLRRPSGTRRSTWPGWCI